MLHDAGFGRGGRGTTVVVVVVGSVDVDVVELMVDDAVEEDTSIAVVVEEVVVDEVEVLLVGWVTMTWNGAEGGDI
jgi:hypothetical protein